MEIHAPNRLPWIQAGWLGNLSGLNFAYKDAQFKFLDGQLDKGQGKQDFWLVLGEQRYHETFFRASVLNCVLKRMAAPGDSLHTDDEQTVKQIFANIFKEPISHNTAESDVELAKVLKQMVLLIRNCLSFVWWMRSLLLPPVGYKSLFVLQRQCLMISGSICMGNWSLLEFELVSVVHVSETSKATVIDLVSSWFVTMNLSACDRAWSSPVERLRCVHQFGLF